MVAQTAPWCLNLLSLIKTECPLRWSTLDSLNYQRWEPHRKTSAASLSRPETTMSSADLRTKLVDLGALRNGYISQEERSEAIPLHASQSIVSSVISLAEAFRKRKTAKSGLRLSQRLWPGMVGISTMSAKLM